MKKFVALTAFVLASCAVPSFADTIDCTTQADNLVANCGYETGDLTGWTQSGNLGFTGVTTSPYNHSGTYGAFLGPVGSDGFFSQNLATDAGGTYELTYWLMSDGNTPNHFDVGWDGVTIVNNNNFGAFPYTQSQFLLTATTASTQLRFSFRNDPGFLGLDDITVRPIPEPTTLLLLGTGMLAIARRRAAGRRQN